MTLPTPRAALVFLAAGALPVAQIIATGRASVTLWAIGVSTILLLLLIDALLAPSWQGLSVRHEVPTRLYVGEPEAMEVRLRRTLSVGGVEVACEHGPGIDPLTPVRAVGRGEVALELALRGQRRGAVRLHRLHVRWSGPLGLLRELRKLPLDAEVPILSDVFSPRGDRLSLLSRRSDLMGGRAQRFLGDGTEFDSLREFVPGLDPRAINWRATARHHKLMVEERRAERAKTVLVALDTGRLMGEELEGKPRLDRAITAGLLLARVALWRNDLVGLHAFAAQPSRFVAPRGGRAHINVLQQAAVTLDYSEDETNFTLGMLELSRRLTRRALVVVLTDFQDSISADLLVENLSRVARRHLVLFVALREPALGRLAGAVPEDAHALAHAVVARSVLDEREQVLRRLRSAGVLCLDTEPEELSGRLISRYLEIQRREQL